MSKTQPQRTGVVQVGDGRRVAYELYGARNGYPVVYSHGGLSSHSDIAFADAAAASSGINIIAIDRPGIGLSDRLKFHRVVDWSGDVDAVTNDLGVDRFSVLGWSAGGPYALACAATMGPKVVKAVTIGGMAPLEGSVSANQLGLKVDRVLFPLAQRSQLTACALLWLSKATPHRVVRSQLMKSVQSSADRDVIGSMSASEVVRDLAEAMRRGPHGVVDDYAALARDWGFRLQDVTSPVSVFQGAEDRLLPMAHAESLARRLASARLEVVPDAGHFLMHSALPEVLEALAP